MQTPKEIRICMDIGCHQHRVLIGLANGIILEEFDLPHTSIAINQFFQKTESLQNKYSAKVVFAMEGFDGHARSKIKGVYDISFPINTYDVRKHC